MMKAAYSASFELRLAELAELAFPRSTTCRSLSCLSLAYKLLYKRAVLVMKSVVTRPFMAMKIAACSEFKNLIDRYDFVAVVVSGLLMFVQNNNELKKQQS
jgi:hypothetical protein